MRNLLPLYSWLETVCSFQTLLFTYRFYVASSPSWEPPIWSTSAFLASVTSQCSPFSANTGSQNLISLRRTANCIFQAAILRDVQLILYASKWHSSFIMLPYITYEKIKREYVKIVSAFRYCCTSGVLEFRLHLLLVFELRTALKILSCASKTSALWQHSMKRLILHYIAGRKVTVAPLGLAVIQIISVCWSVASNTCCSRLQKNLWR